MSDALPAHLRKERIHKFVKPRDCGDVGRATTNSNSWCAVVILWWQFALVFVYSSMASGFTAYLGKNRNSTSVRVSRLCDALLVVQFSGRSPSVSPTLTINCPVSWMRRNLLLDVHWRETECQDSGGVLARNFATGRGVFRQPFQQHR